MQNLTLERLARNIGREPRFCGDTGKYWWSVLHHSFLVEAISFAITDNDETAPIRRDEIRLWALIHDLHEGLTGDLKTPDKTPEMRKYQGELDQEIYREIGIYPPDTEAKSIVKLADTRALIAEAYSLKDPYFTQTSCYQKALESLVRSDLALFDEVQERYGSPTLTTSPFSRGVTDYIELVKSLTSSVVRTRVYSLDNRHLSPALIADALQVSSETVQKFLAGRGRRRRRAA